MNMQTLERWLLGPAESEHLEFKEAKSTYDPVKLMKYCVALANEGGGHLVLGVSDKHPRQVVSTKAFESVSSLNQVKAQIVDKLHIRVETSTIDYDGKRVLCFSIPSRPIGRLYITMEHI